MKKITLVKSADIDRRIEIIKVLLNKAEARVRHSDLFRQRNMNYALVVFAGLIALRVKLVSSEAQIVISATLLVLSIIFCVWDRRWQELNTDGTVLAKSVTNAWLN